MVELADTTPSKRAAWQQALQVQLLLAALRPHRLLGRGLEGIKWELYEKVGSDEINDTTLPPPEPTILLFIVENSLAFSNPDKLCFYVPFSGQTIRRAWDRIFLTSTFLHAYRAKRAGQNTRFSLKYRRVTASLLAPLFLVVSDHRPLLLLAETLDITPLFVSIR